MSISDEMKAHLADNATLAVFIKITAKDSTVLSVTNCTRNKIIDGLTYHSIPLSPSQLQATAGLKPDNMELVTILGGLYTAATLRNKKWFGARVEYMVYNYQDFSMGVANRKVGYVGETEIGKFTAKPELLSISSKLSQETGTSYLEGCDVLRLGNARCGVNLDGTTVQGYKIRIPAEVTAVSNIQQFTVAFTDFIKPSDHSVTTAPTDYFHNGEAEFTSGNNDGARMLVLGSSGNSLTLWIPAFYGLQVGDELILTAGCNRSIEECVEKFNNGPRNRGFWALPGREKLLKY